MGGPSPSMTRTFTGMRLGRTLNKARSYARRDEGEPRRRSRRASKSARSSLTGPTSTGPSTLRVRPLACATLQVSSESLSAEARSRHSRQRVSRAASRWMTSTSTGPTKPTASQRSPRPEERPRRWRRLARALWVPSSSLAPAGDRLFVTYAPGGDGQVLSSLPLSGDAGPTVLVSSVSSGGPTLLVVAGPTQLFWLGFGTAIEINESPVHGGPTKTLAMPLSPEVGDLALSSDGTLYWTTDLQVQWLMP